MEKVAVVVPVRNRWKKTARFLESFKDQDYENLTIYIVDSNSSDETRDILLSLSSKDLVAVSAGDEDYWAGATNRGIEQALRDGCDFIFTINDDSRPAPQIVKKLVDCAHIHQLPIVGSRVNFLQDPALVWSVGSYNQWGTHLIFQLNDNNVYDEDIKLKYGAMPYVEVEFMPGNGVLIHRSVFDKIGLYDEKNYPHYHADSEFILRAKKHGFKAAICLDAVVFNDVDVVGLKSDFLKKNRPLQKYFSLPVLGRVIEQLVAFWDLFFSKRSERRLSTLLHFLNNYCPPGYKVKTFVMYMAHAFVRFVFPVLASPIRRLQILFARIRKISASPSVLLQALSAQIKAHMRSKNAIKSLRNKKAD